MELSLSLRQINRLVKKYKEEGKAAFVHGNQGSSPKHAVPKEIKEKIIQLYLSYSIKPNVVHFTEHLSEKYGICYSDTTIRSILSAAFILSPKAQRKTRREMKKKMKTRKEKKKHFFI